jgi:hypothetical protein
MRRILTLFVAAGLGAALIASAANLMVFGAAIQAGGDHDLTCDADGVGVNWGWESSDDTVRFVRVAGIADACVGAELAGVVTTTIGNFRLGPVDITANGTDPDDNSVRFTLNPWLAPSVITGIDLTLEGPNKP